jgi:hypothetical protein
MALGMDKDGAMKLLLTSGGVSNQSIRAALVDMLGKPMAESTALCIPTAMYGMPGTAVMTWSLSETVYVGLSAGSMVMAPHVGQEFVGWQPAAGGDSALGMVGFSIFPHLDNVMCPENTMADAEKWAARMPVPGFAVDDQTAITVVDGVVEVVSEGHWRLFDR